jgi:hypothetical protein
MWNQMSFKKLLRKWIWLLKNCYRENGSDFENDEELQTCLFIAGL